ncbi:hypothetical protein Ccrd_025494 [Cynara cardunculus var. scolymus]|uniref:Leucine-rich repeat-containing protein n=1 Tax=Cynara cardunculus var. scolymus TaxID=59895 RepID=A0A103WXX6_CYNCS|nr:hypothetical protein Ccrd_025494 [Cynara cardunculus var. scolymus]
MCVQSFFYLISIAQLSGSQLLRSLKILNLSFCEQLWSVGGFSKFPALERLILSNCSSLIEICESIEQYDGLDLIDLSYCNNAGKLLRTINKVKNVKILKLDGCNHGETTVEMMDDVEEMLNCNNIGMNSKTSFSAIVEAIPRAFESYLIYVPSSLECGVSLVYDEDEEEEVLGYYKSWNHRIGGDLSPFLTTAPGQYRLNQDRFYGGDYINYVDKHPLFRAFRPTK